MKYWTIVAACWIAALPMAVQAGPTTTVATISGCYDCYNNFDTPVLVFNNSTGGLLTNAQMVLTGYQGQNAGKTTTVQLGTLGTGPTVEAWGLLPGASSSTSPFNLTAYDYDDEFVNSQYMISNTNCESTGNPNTAGCVGGGGTQFYAQTGNFSVTFTATVSGGAYNGQSVYSVFSPTNNATGQFVGWEGLNVAGFSEDPAYDVHTGVITGDLANINLGSVPPPPSSVPEPASWALAALGLGLMGFAIRRRTRANDRAA